MSLVCPNQNHPEWRKLVSKIGRRQAMLEFTKNGNEIPSHTLYNRVAYKDKKNYAVENIEETKKWFEDRFDGVSFEVVKELIDGKSFGQFYNGLVTLYENAEIGTGYHEAFHKVTQLYLTDKQRKSLYREASIIKGKELTELQAEELLAEDFREYMLNGQNTILGQPKRNSIFRKILNAIMHFINGTVDIQSVYEKLASAKGYSGKKKVGSASGIKLNRVLDFTEHESRLILNDMTGIFFKVVLFDTKLDQRITPQTFLTKKADEQKELVDAAYEEVQELYKESLEDIVLSLEEEPNNLELKNLKTFYEILIKDFDKVKNKHIDYMVQYGIKISKGDESVQLIENDGTTNSEEETNDDPDVQTKDISKDIRDNIPASEVNPIETLTNNTKLLLASLYKMELVLAEDSDGNYVEQYDVAINDLGREELVNFDAVYNKLTYSLIGLNTPIEIYNKLEELLSEGELYVADLIDKLGHPKDIPTGTFENFSMWRDFVKDMSKTFTENTITIVDPQTGNIYADQGMRHNIREHVIEKWRTNLLRRDSVKNVDGISVLRTDVLNETNSLRFLEKLGIKFEGFTDAEAAAEINKVFPSGLDMFVDGPKNSIKSAILNHEGEITDIFDATFDHRNDFLKLADIAGERYKGKIELSTRNAEGKRIYGITQHNYISLVADAINNSNTIEELLAKHPFIFNAYNERSLWLNAIYPKNSKGRRVKVPGVKLNISIAGGLKEQGGDGSSTTSLSITDKVIQEFNDFFKLGGVSLPRASDKSTEYAIRIIYPDGKVRHAIEDVTDKAVQDALLTSFKDELDRIRTRRIDNKGSDIKVYGDNKSIKDYTIKDASELDIVDLDGAEQYLQENPESAKLFKNSDLEYSSYLNYIRDNKKSNTIEEQKYWVEVVRPLGYIPHSSKAANWSIFEDILTPETKATLEESNLLNDYDEEVSPELEKLVREDITSYVNQMIKEETAYIKALKIGEDVRWDAYEDGKKVSKSGKFGISAEILDDNSKLSTDMLIKKFIVNHFVETIEHHKVLIGDPALFKDKFKRISAFVGNKDFVNGGVFTEWVNNNREFATDNNGNVWEYEDSDNMNTAVVKDVEKISKMLDAYSEIVDPSKMGEYKKMNEADAQGLIDLIAYRRLSMKANRWTTEQEAQYKYEMLWEKKNLMKQELTTDEQAILDAGEQGVFPILKAQYAGPQNHSSKLNIQSFHKYSLAPIFPRLVQGTILESKLQQMRAKEIGYMVFDSGSKVGTKVGVDGSQHDIFKDTEFRVDHIQQLNNQYLGIQVDIKPKAKKQVVFGSQFRKLIESNLFGGGIPIDYKGKADWDTLTDEQKEESSDLYKLHSEYIKIVDQLAKNEWDGLIKELGVTYKDGELSLDKQKLVDLIREEAISRNLSDNVIESVATETRAGEVVLKYQLDSLVNRNKIEGLLMSLVNSRVIRQQMPGDGMIQLATTGFKKENATYDDTLLTYRKDTSYLDSHIKDVKNLNTLVQHLGGRKIVLNGEIPHFKIGTLEKKLHVKLADILEDFRKISPDSFKDLISETDVEKLKEITKDFDKFREVNMLVSSNDIRTTSNVLEYATLTRSIQNRILSVLNPYIEKRLGAKLELATLPHVDTNLLGELDEQKKTAKTLPSQVKVSLNAQYKDLIKVYKKPGMSDDDTLNAINKAIRDKTIDKRLLTMVGYRIPTQGMNSIEHLEIVEFLPPSTMNAIIMPSEIVAKSGGDFDIDKLNIFRPNFKIEAGDKSEVDFINDKIKKANEINRTVAEEKGNKNYSKFSNVTEDKLDRIKNKEGNLTEYEKYVMSSVKGYEKYLEKGAYVNYTDNYNRVETSKIYAEYQPKLDKINNTIKKSRDMHSAKIGKLIEASDLTYAQKDEAIAEKVILKSTIEEIKDEISELADVIKYLRKNSDDASSKLMTSIFGDTKSLEEYEEELESLRTEREQLKKNYSDLIKLVGDVSETSSGLSESIKAAIAKKRLATDKYRGKKAEIVAERQVKLDAIKGVTSQPISDTSSASKAELQNRLIEISSQVISHPDNYELLITPNSVDTLKGLVANIREYKGISVSPPSQTKQLRYSHIMDQFRYFLGGKDGVGPAAIHNTFHTLFQLANTRIKPEVNFEVNRDATGAVLLGGRQDTKGRYISDIISQFINAYVDVAKDPFYKDLNAGMQVEPIYFYLIHMGADIETISYFLTQPIISEYTDLLEANDSIANKAYGQKSRRDKIKSKVVKKYVKRYNTLAKKQGLPEIDAEGLTSEIVNNNELLLSYMGKGYSDGKLVPIESIKDLKYLADQIQFINDYEKYHKDAKELSDLTKTLNYDTSRLKDLAALDMYDDGIHAVESSNLFSAEHREAIKQASIVGSFDFHSEINKIYSPLFNTEAPEFKSFKKGIISLSNVFKKDDKVKMHTLINNDFVNYIIQSYGVYDSTELYSSIDHLFKGSDSLAHRLADIKDMLPDNYLVEQLTTILSPDERAINNIALFNKKYSVEDSNMLTMSFRELIENSEPIISKFAKDLVAHGIVQSGLNNSPITYLGLIPHEEYQNISEAALRRFQNVSNKKEVYNDFAIRFFLKNIDKKFVVKPGDKIKKGGKWLFDENQPGSIAVTKEKDGPHTVWFHANQQWVPHTSIKGLENVEVNRYGYKLQEFYLKDSSSINLSIFDISKRTPDNKDSDNTDNLFNNFEGEAFYSMEDSSDKNTGTTVKDIFNGDRKMSAVDALTEISKLDSEKVSAEVAKKLLEYGIRDIPIYIEEETKLNELSVTGQASIRGIYLPSSDTIAVLENAKPKTIIHEVLHALSVKELESNSEVKQELENIYNIAKEHGTMNHLYAMTDLDEFMVGIFTDPKLISGLQKLPASNNKELTLWEDIVDTIAKLLGRFFPTESDRTLFSEAMSAGVAVLNAREHKAPVVSQSTKESVPEFISEMYQDEELSSTYSIDELNSLYEDSKDFLSEEQFKENLENKIKNC